MMKKILLISLLGWYGTAMAADNQAVDLNPKDLGYSVGYLLGKTSVRSVENDVDFNRLVQGLTDATHNNKPAIAPENMANILAQYKEQRDHSEWYAFQRQAKQQQQDGEAFLQQNLKAPQVQHTASGLQYQIIKQGNGKRPKADSQVTVLYEGRLIDGTVFDSAIARDKPVTFALNQVIQGWQEGLQLMKEGSTYRFFIPANLAYGKIGAGDSIPPNSVLIFDVELLKVEK